MAVLKFKNPNTGLWEPISSTGGSDHGSLTGLTDDDHPQYTNFHFGLLAPNAPRLGMFWMVAR